MPSVYQLKPQFQNLLRPLTRTLASIGVSANHVTVAAMILSILAGLAVLWWKAASLVMLIIPLALFLRMALNAIDGILAREHGMKSHLGAILNELGDVVSDAALYLPFAFIPGISPDLVVSVVLLAVISEMIGVVAVQIGASRRYDGPMGKSDRAFAFGAIALALALGWQPGIWLQAVLWIIAGLLGLTILNRARRALLEVSG